MSRSVLWRAPLVLGLVVVTGFGATPVWAEAQLGKRLLQIGACGAGAVGGVKLGDKIAEFEAKRRNLSPAEAARHKKAFQIGMALALCGGGAAIAGTTYSKLSKRGQEARQRELMAALEDAKPRTYSDPERPTLTGTWTPQPINMEGNKECRVVEDYLADGAQNDAAIVKYCRPATGGEWKLENF